MPRLEDVEVGAHLASERQTITQADLVRYAGASGDFNPLHWDEGFAAGVSPTGGVIAHGMLNMGYVARLVTAWAGGPEHVVYLAAHFRAACPVGATVEVGAEVVAVDAEARTATLAVWVILPDGSPVVDRKRSRATVRLA
jgi:acyl dehydratase